MWLMDENFIVSFITIQTQGKLIIDCQNAFLTFLTKNMFS